MNDANIILRNICYDDLEDIKKLHEDFFPVRYSHDYYQSVISGKGFNGGLLTTVVAESILTKEILGFVFYQYINTSSCEDDSIFGVYKSKEICYILVIGLRSSCRGKGLGSVLMKKCIEDARNNKNCGAVYLHVIHYNKAAINFYEKNNFICLRKLSDFYCIDNLFYDAFLYVYYVNGFKPPLTFRLIENFMYVNNIFSYFQFILS